MVRRVVVAVVDTEHDRDVLVLGRRRDDDLLGAIGDVDLGLLGVGEQAGGLDDDVCAELAPLEVGGVALREGLEGLAGRGDVGVGRGHVTVEAAQDRVVLEQVGQGGVVGQVVDRDDLDVGAGRQGGAVEVAADAAEAIDAYANSHDALPFRKRGRYAASSRHGSVLGPEPIGCRKGPDRTVRRTGG